VIEERDEVGRGHHLDVAGPGRLAALVGGADQAEAARRGVEGGEQHAGRRRDAAVEAELPDRDVAGEQLAIDRAHRGEQAERDRQIVVGALLGQIGRARG
jgi:hypothetical protein